MYAKLYQQVATSSLTQNETIVVRGVFFMLLAVADREGHVLGTDGAIARIINVDRRTFDEAVGRLMQPDPDSMSQDEEGRRVIRMTGVPGLFVVNYEKYSGMANDAERRAYYRQKKVESRERLRGAGAKAGGNVNQAEESKPGPGFSAPVARGGRLHGLPASVEEVIAFGATLNPLVSEERCREFWGHYEGQRRMNPNEEIFWVGSGDNPAVITNWKVRLPTFGTAFERRPARAPRGQRREADIEPVDPRFPLAKMKVTTVDEHGNVTVT